MQLCTGSAVVCSRHSREMRYSIDAPKLRFCRLDDAWPEKQTPASKVTNQRGPSCHPAASWVTPDVTEPVDAPGRMLSVLNPRSFLLLICDRENSPDRVRRAPW